MMSYLHYIIKNPRSKKISKKLKLKTNPQNLAVCLRVLTVSPKKPNSANRRVASVTFINPKLNNKLLIKIPGEGHQLQQHSTLLVRGARIRDLIGVSYSGIRGKYDLLGVANRKTSRSRYGVKKKI